MGRTEQVELTNMCMLRREDGCVLVQNRLSKSWGGLTFPGGHVEPGESMTDAVIREMQEETGLTVSGLRLVGVKDWPQDGGGRYVVLLYTASAYTGTLSDSEEGPMQWMTLEEMRKGRMVSGMESMLRVFLEEELTEMWFERTEGGWLEVLK